MALIVVGVTDPGTRQAGGTHRLPLRPVEMWRLGEAYWAAMPVAVLMTLARFSEAFLILRAESVGLAPALVPTALVAMNVVYAGSAYAVGRLSDRLGRRGLLGVGFAVLVAADVVLARTEGIWAVLVGSSLWGLHMGMTQGLLATLVADAAPPAVRGTAFGLFSLVTGLALLAASALAGWLWAAIGPAAPFGAGAAFAALALLSLVFVSR